MSITARGLSVRIGGNLALDDVSFEVPSGATVALLGPNGAGKTTIFRAAIGLLRPHAGSIELGSTSGGGSFASRPGPPSVAFVPQRLEIEPSFPVTVTDVVRMGRYGDLGWLGRFRDRDHELVAAALEALEISDLADRRFGDLSGGERQRALLAQAAAQDADILLLDEPFTGLDAPTRETLHEKLTAWRSDGRTVVVATHDLESAGRDFDLVCCLNRRLVAFGPPATTLSEEVLAQTFAGRVVRVGSLLVDTEHHHHGAG